MTARACVCVCIKREKKRETFPKGDHARTAGHNTPSDIRIIKIERVSVDYCWKKEGVEWKEYKYRSEPGGGVGILFHFPEGYKTFRA